VERACEVLAVALSGAGPRRDAVAAGTRRPLELVKLEDDGDVVATREADDRVDGVPQVVPVEHARRRLEIVPGDRQPDHVDAPARHLREVGLLGAVRGAREVAELQSRVVHPTEQYDAPGTIAEPGAVASNPPGQEIDRARERWPEQDRGEDARAKSAGGPLVTMEGGGPGCKAPRVKDRPTRRPALALPPPGPCDR